MSEVDCFETPVWALYGSNDDAQIIHAPLPRWQDKRQLPSRMWGEGGLWTSRSRWYLTREELIEGEGIMPACSECGKPFKTTYCKPYPELLRERNLCFHCNIYVHEKLPHYGKPGHVVIGCTTYSWDVKHPMVVLRNGGDGYGHGGREFAIKLLATGEIIHTNNLWCGGQIPERFLSRMPDNATFEKIPAPVGHGQGFLG